MRYLLDTNVFYDLASGELDYSKFIGQFRGDNFYGCPINCIEIITSPNPFDLRKNAVDMFLKCLSEGMRILPDSNYALRYQLKEGLFEDTGEVTNLIQGIRIFCKADSEKELKQGFRFGYHPKIYKQNLDDIIIERNSTYEGWQVECEIMKKKIIAHYGGKDKLRGQPLKDYRKEKKDIFTYENALPGLLDKVYLSLGEMLENVTSLPDNLKPYADLYFMYCIRLFEDDANSEKNDFGDIEQLIYYGQYIDKFITSEGKWFDLAVRAGYTNMYVTPDILC